MKSRRLNLDRYKDKPPAPEPEAEVHSLEFLRTKLQQIVSAENGSITTRIAYDWIDSEDDFARILPLAEGWTRHVNKSVERREWIIYDQPPIPAGEPPRHAVLLFGEPVYRAETASGCIRWRITRSRNRDLRDRITEEVINQNIPLARGYTREIRIDDATLSWVVVDTPLRLRAQVGGFAAMVGVDPALPGVPDQTVNRYAYRFPDAPTPPRSATLQSVLRTTPDELREMVNNVAEQARESAFNNRTPVPFMPPPSPPPPPPARMVREDGRPTDAKGNATPIWRLAWNALREKLRRKLLYKHDDRLSTEKVVIAERAREAVAINHSVPRETIPDLIVPASLQGYVSHRDRDRITFVLNVEDLTASGHFLTIMRLMPLPPEGWNVVQTFTARVMVQFTYWRNGPDDPML